MFIPSAYPDVMNLPVGHLEEGRNLQFHMKLHHILSIAYECNAHIQTKLYSYLIMDIVDDFCFRNSFGFSGM